jgi:hypothetical protein
VTLHFIKENFCSSTTSNIKEDQDPSKEIDDAMRSPKGQEDTCVSPPRCPLVFSGKNRAKYAWSSSDQLADKICHILTLSATKTALADDDDDDDRSFLLSFVKSVPT